MNQNDRQKRAARRRRKKQQAGEESAETQRSPWRVARLFLLLGILGVLFWNRALWWPPLMHQGAVQALKSHDPQTALNWLDRVAWLVAQDADTELLKAGAYRRLGEMDECATSLRRAQEYGAEVGELQREQILAQAQSGQLSEAAPHLSRLLQDQSHDPTEVCEAYVIGYLRNQRHPEALELLNAWIADAPKDAVPYLKRGQIYRLRREPNLAEKDVRRAVELDPQYHEAALELGEILLDRNQPGEAQPFLEQCITDPEFGIAASVALAECLKSSGENERALALLKNAVATEPKNARAQRELGRAYVEEGAYELAIQALSESVEIAPRDDETHYLLAQAYSLSGNTAEAEPHFEYVTVVRQALDELDQINDVLAKDPNNVDAKVRAGEILLEFADPGEGVVRLLAALDLDSDNSKALRLLADYYRGRANEDPDFRDLADEFESRAAGSP